MGLPAMKAPDTQRKLINMESIYEQKDDGIAFDNNRHMYIKSRRVTSSVKGEENEIYT